MILKPEVSIGDLLTIISIAVSFIALLVSWRKDQDLRRKEYADRIRRSAGTIVAKLQRWRDLTLRFFEDVQPLITEADMTLLKRQPVLAVRDFFWRGMVDARAKSSQRIVEEQIEIAYVDLYGYDPRIQILFGEVINRLKLIDQSMYTQALYSTQSDILRFQSLKPPYSSAQLGNELRNTCYLLAEESSRLMDEAIAPFSLEMIKVIEKDDQQIVKRHVSISATTELYPVSFESLREQLARKVKEKLAQTAHVFTTAQSQAENEASTLSPNLVPLKVQDQVIGVLSLDSSHHDVFLEEEQKALTDFAEQANRAIEEALSDPETNEDLTRGANPRKRTRARR